MSTKEQYIRENRERRYKIWLVRTGFYGSFLFMMLSGLDYIITPENFRTFFVYRVFVALLLVAIAFVANETDSWGIRFHKWLGVCAVSASAGTIELMIMRFGGHDSPYAAGQILLGVCVLGFIPAWMSLHFLFAAIIYLIYVVPIALFDWGGHSAMFMSANGFLFASLISALVLRSLSERSLNAELSLQYDLLQSEQKYRDLFEHAIDPIFVVDADLRYVDANQKAAELTGFTKEELKRRTILDMIPPEQGSRSGAEFDKLRQRGAYEKFEGKMVRKDGSLLDIEVSSSAVIRDGKIIGSHDFVREITDRKRFHDELKQPNEELDQHMRERTEALTEMNRVMEREIAERRKTEQKID